MQGSAGISYPSALELRGLIRSMSCLWGNCWWMRIEPCTSKSENAGSPFRQITQPKPSGQCRRSSNARISADDFDFAVLALTRARLCSGLILDEVGHLQAEIACIGGIS